MSELTVAQCSYEAAKYAVMHWHYSRSMPAAKIVRFGVWENSQFVGTVLFGRGANPVLSKPYGLDQTEVCELVRVALNKHEHSVSQIVAKSLKLLKDCNPRLRLVVSYADLEQGHRGGIYQAGNWLYSGLTRAADEYIVNGRRYHGRALRITRETHRGQAVLADNVLGWARKVLDSEAYAIAGSQKHRYLYPLDRAMRRQIEPLRLPYPPAVEGSTVSRDASGVEGQVRPLPTARKESCNDG